MEMTEIWKSLPQDLLIHVLARLPVETIVSFRAVCKHWKQMIQSSEFKRLVATLAISSTQAFLVVEGRKQLFIDSSQPVIDSSQPLYVKNLYISTENSYKSHSFSLDFLPSPVVVVAGCKSVLCCWSGKDEIYICNPVTQTWIELPQRAEQTRWDFISLAFDTSTACCTLILGRNSKITLDEIYIALRAATVPRRSSIVVEMYESKTNNWIQIEKTVDNLVRAQGEGIYSNGIYYWLNKAYDGESLNIVAFDGEQKQWNLINGPQNARADLLSQTVGTSFVTGCEGHVVLACCTSHPSLWELSIDAEEKWSPLKTLDDIEEPELTRPMFSIDMAVNQSGCILVFLSKMDAFVVCNREGKISQKIMFGQLVDSSDDFRYHISVRSFQVNNIFWP